MNENDKAVKREAKTVMRERGANTLTGRAREDAWLEARDEAKRRLAVTS